MPVALLASLSSLGPPQAGPPPTVVELRWTAPGDCPSKEDVEAELQALTDGTVTVVDEAPTLVDATVSEAAEGFRLQLRVERRGVVETQSMESKTCDTLARAVVLVAGVDLSQPADPTPPARTADPPPLPLVESPPEPRDEPVATSNSSASREPTEHPAAPIHDDTTPPNVRVVLGMEAGPSLGLVPNITAALIGSVGVRMHDVQLDVSGFHHFEASEGVARSARIAGRLSGGAARGCWVPDIDNFEFPLCGGFALAALRTSPSANVQSPRTLSDLWAGATLSAAVAWRIRERFAATLRLEGAASLRRPGVHWTVDGEERPVFRVKPVAGALLLGPQVQLP